MRIERVEPINLRYEYPNASGFQNAGGTCTARLTTLILIHTDTGHVGVGSVYSHPALVYLIVRDQLDPLLRGEDPTRVEALWEKIYGVTRWYGRKGVTMSAIGGVDTALWDLKGQSEGKPVWKLLGGTEGVCPAYASGLLWNEIDALAEEAIGHIDAGFKRVKMRLARSEEWDREAVIAVRKAIGPEHDVIVDASMRYNVALARRMGKFLEDMRVFWYEEPFAPEDIDSFVALQGAVGIPVSAGENEFGLQGFRELIRAKAVNIVQPDSSRCGGISEVVKVAQLAGANGLRVATHTWSDAVAVTANAHVVSAISNGITVEIDRTGTPFVEDLLVDPLEVSNGQLTLGDRPGLGIQLDMDVVERLRMANPLKIPDGSYSDMMFGKAYEPPSLPYVEIDA